MTGQGLPVHHFGDLQLGAQGLGCMGLSELRGPVDEQVSTATLRAAFDAGVTFFDTADVYGHDGENERHIAKALGSHRDEIVIASKFGVVRTDDDHDRLPGSTAAGSQVNGRPEHARLSCERSLRRLRTDRIDLYFVHRMDPSVPIEDTVGAIVELVTAGKVAHIGLSECSARTLRRAAAVHPIAAVESEYSLLTRGIENEILPSCRELGTGLVPYSPLGRGLLTGRLVELSQLHPTDLRLQYPWFEPSNFAANIRLVERLAPLAADRGCSMGQLALAWLRAQGTDIVPIPGAQTTDQLRENVAAVSIDLTAVDLAAIDAAVPMGAVHGDRYVDMESVTGETPAVSGR